MKKLLFALLIVMFCVFPAYSIGYTLSTDENPSYMRNATVVDLNEGDTSRMQAPSIEFKAYWLPGVFASGAASYSTKNVVSFMENSMTLELNSAYSEDRITAYVYPKSEEILVAESSFWCIGTPQDVSFEIHLVDSITNTVYVYNTTVPCIIPQESELDIKVGVEGSNSEEIISYQDVCLFNMDGLDAYSIILMRGEDLLRCGYDAPLYNFNNTILEKEEAVAGDYTVYIVYGEPYSKDFADVCLKTINFSIVDQVNKK